MARVLIVDDDPLIRELLEIMLTRDGHQTYHASDGEEGVRRFQEVRPELTLLDVVMPILNGKEALAQMKGINPSAAVIMMSGSGGDSLAKECAELGADQFIRKGMSPGAFLKLVRSALNNGVLNGHTPPPRSPE